jgi:hypothetical protein
MAPQKSKADVDFGISVGDEGIRGFYLAIGEHFQVETKKIVVAREKKIPDEDMPVVFFIAGKAGVGPEAIIKLRLGGKSWMDITFHYGLTAEIFYVPLKKDPGPPYGKAWGHFKNRKKTDWKSVRFTDVEVVNFVNLKFMSEHYGYSPDEVVKMRSGGKNFITINAEIKKNKGQAKKEAKKIAAQSEDKPESKGKGKKK